MALFFEDIVGLENDLVQAGVTGPLIVARDPRKCPDCPPTGPDWVTVEGDKAVLDMKAMIAAGVNGIQVTFGES